MKELPPKHILCVEDDEDTRSMLAYLLRLENYEVATAGSAGDALELAESKPFDLFILDVWLPDENGNSLCRRLRALDPYTPVIIYSGAVSDTDQQAAQQAEADAFVGKPDIKPLLETVRYFLAAKNL
jgi:two-component system, OmpR family, alkaline phosphatase synthesis response regulator PhoP